MTRNECIRRLSVLMTIACGVLSGCGTSEEEISRIDLSEVGAYDEALLASKPDLDKGVLDITTADDFRLRVMPNPKALWEETLQDWEDIRREHPESTAFIDEGPEEGFALVLSPFQVYLAQCTAMNLGDVDATFEMYREYPHPLGRIEWELVSERVVPPNSIAHMNATSRYPTGGEDRFRCIIKLEGSSESTERTVRIGMYYRYLDAVTPEEFFESEYCDSRARQCVSNQSSALTLATDTTREAYFYVWNRSYTEPLVYGIIEQDGCTPYNPSARNPFGQKIRSGRIEPRELIVEVVRPDPGMTSQFYTMKVVPENEEARICPSCPAFADIIVAGAVRYEDASPTCQPSTRPPSEPAPAVREATETVYAYRSSDVWSGPVPFLAYFPSGFEAGFGTIDGELLAIVAPSDIVRSYVASIQIPKRGYTTDDCGTASRVITLYPGEETTPSEIEAIYGTRTPPLPVVVAMCATGDRIADVIPIGINYQYR